MAKETKKLTVKWIMPEDKIIRFIDIEEPCDMNDAVSKLDFAKAGIVDGSEVSAEFENGVVVFLSLAKGNKEAPKQETKKEEPKSEQTAPGLNPNISIVTVGGISSKYKGITFAEGKDVWYDVVEEIGVDNLSKMGIVRGSKVEITVDAPKGKSKNQRIVGIKLVEKKEAPKEDKKPDARNDFDKEQPIEDAPTGKDAFYRMKQLENQVRYLKDNQQLSIEAQGAVERAFLLVSSIVGKEPAESNVKNTTLIKGLLKDYAKEAFDLIQELKKPKA